MNFSFQFILNDNSQIDSQGVVTSPEIYRDAINELYNLSCTVEVNMDGSKWTIEDELGAIIGNFFLTGVTSLKSSGSAQFEQFEVDGQVSSELIHDTVIISGDFVDDLEISLDAFKKLSIDIANHALDFLKSLDNAKHQPDINFIDEKLILVADS